MYGNHSSHSSGFQNPEMTAGGYSYFPSHHHHHLHHHHSHLNESEIGYSSNNIISTSSSSNSSNCTTPGTGAANTHLYTHSHLYSPTAAEYGITTTSQLSTNNSPSDAYYDAENSHSYYNSGSGPSPNSLQDPHIISSDNGLSYTNLDYIYNQSQHNTTGYLHSDDKLHHYNLSESMLIGSGQSNTASSSSAATWHHPSYIENTLPHSIGLNTIGGQNQMGNSNSGNVTHSSASSPGLQHHQQQHQQQQQQQQNIQTYKWMQVKRNVPKPQGELSFFFAIFCEVGR